MLQLIGFTNVAKVLVLKSYCLACEKALPGVRGWGRGKGRSPFPSPTPSTPRVVKVTVKMIVNRCLIQFNFECNHQGAYISSHEDDDNGDVKKQLVLTTALHVYRAFY